MIFVFFYSTIVPESLVGLPEIATLKE